jgi:hypothetical protein
VQVEYFIPPTVNQAEVKKEVLKNVSQKVQTWRCKLKKLLKIRHGNTPDIVRERIGEHALEDYDAEDVRVLIVRWCDEQDHVGYSRVILVFGLFSIISCVCAYISYDEHIENVNCVGVRGLHERLASTEQHSTH